MEIILDHTFDTSAFLTWHHQASSGDTCTVIIPAMQDWHFTITKTGEDGQLLLDPDGKRPRRITLDDLMRMFESMRRALASLGGQKTA
jgi:hypothetical protein